MANVIKAALGSTNEAGKILAGMTTQVLVLGTTSMNALKDNSDYAKGLAEGSWGYALDSDRALEDNASVVSRIKETVDMKSAVEDIKDGARKARTPKSSRKYY